MSSKRTKQMEFWSGKFGTDYISRNTHNLEGVDSYHLEKYGSSKTDMSREFLGDLDRNIKILEVGCNIGCQMVVLQRIGFENLYGIELNLDAIEESKRRHKNLNIIWGTALDIPFKDGFFDLVFTSGVLIHINPDDLRDVMGEIYRTTNKYIWGFEYFAETPTEIKYHGHENLLWKMDYVKKYQEFFPDLKVAKRKLYDHSDSDNQDQMFLLSK